MHKTTGEFRHRSKIFETWKSKREKEQRIGHCRVDPVSGETSYKNTPSLVLSRCVQKGITFALARETGKSNRDILLQDFETVETILFPREGSKLTPAHPFEDFVFRVYAPAAFKYFRELFGIVHTSYMLSISQPLQQLANPGKSGSLFFVTHDDEYIIKTLQHKEADFLQKLLPGYYMNLVQNPRTMLPKFFGLYCVRSKGKNIRIVVMNNLIPSQMQIHYLFDIKGSTFKRRANKRERLKSRPVYKDLDFSEKISGGLFLERKVHAAFVKTLKRDCLVLESFKIMDYSLLVAIHNIDQCERDTRRRIFKGSCTDEASSTSLPLVGGTDNTPELQRHSLFDELYNCRYKYARRSAFLASTITKKKYTDNLNLWSGGIPMMNDAGERLLVYCGIIDILQCYKLAKKLEHSVKSIFTDSKTISVHQPSFYGSRFLEFVTTRAIKSGVSREPSVRKKKSVTQQSTRRPSPASQFLDPESAMTERVRSTSKSVSTSVLECRSPSKTVVEGVRHSITVEVLNQDDLLRN